MKIEKLEDLEIWKVSRQLSKLIYQVTKEGNFSKDYRFKDQIRAASGSVMDNIAEGFGRGGTKELITFLAIARGSNEEIRSQLYRAFDNEYISQQEFNSAMALVNEISNKVSAFINYLKDSDFKGTRYA